MIKFQLKFASTLFLATCLVISLILLLSGGYEELKRGLPLMLFICGSGAAFGGVFSIMFAGDERHKKWEEDRERRND